MKNIRIFLMIIALGLFSTDFLAQNDFEWVHRDSTTWRIQSESSCTDSLGNTYVTGVFYAKAYFGSSSYDTGNNTFPRMFVVKYSPNGTVLWSREIKTATARSICIDKNNDCYVTGLYNGTTYLDDDTLTGSGVLIVKLQSSNGFEIWGRTAGSSGVEPASISVDNSGCCNLTGRFTGTVTIGSNTLVALSGNFDIFLSRYSSSGNVLWGKRVGGGIDQDVGFGVVCDDAGALYIGGGFGSPATIGTTSFTATDPGVACIIKYDSMGTFLWVKGYGGPGIDEPRKIGIDSQKNLYLTGRYTTITYIGKDTLKSYGGQDIFVAKFDGSGNPIWAKTAGSKLGDTPLELYTARSGNSFLTAVFGDTAYFGPYALFAKGSADIAICKVDSSGRFYWIKQFGGKGADGVANYFHTAPLGVDQFENAYIVPFAYSNPVDLGIDTTKRIPNFGGHSVVKTGTNLFVRVGNNICPGDSIGYADLTVEAGTPPYTYLWSNGATTEDISNLKDGFYVVHVTDKNGFVSATRVAIAAPVLTLSMASKFSSCNGSPTGTATLTVSGGKAPYTYSWSNGATTKNLTGLADGIYTVTVTTSDGCRQTAAATVGPMILTINGIYNCSNSSNNSVLLNVTEIPDSLPNGYCTPSSNCSSGNYAVARVYFNSLVNITNNDCPSNGHIYFNNKTTTVLADSTYSLKLKSSSLGLAFGVWIDYNRDGDFNDAQEFVYTSTKVDTITFTANITIPSFVKTGKVKMRVMGRSFVMTQTQSCITFGFGEVEDYDISLIGKQTYLWSTGATTKDITGLATGTYSVVVTNSKGCTRTASVTINGSNLVVNNTLTNINCNGQVNGSITLNMSTGLSPYTYLWSDLATTSTVNNLSAGTYSVTVTDANNCTATKSFVITEPAALVANPSVTSVLICKGASTTLSATASGGSGSYSFTWNPGFLIGQNVVVSPTVTTIYSLTVTDGNGCSSGIKRDTVNVTICTDVDVHQQGPGPRMTAIPNPNNGEFSLELSGVSGEALIEIYNLLGQSVFKEKVTSSTVKIGLNGQGKGIYLCRLLSLEGLPLTSTRILIE